MTQYLRYEGVNTQNTALEGESGLQLVQRSPVLILIQSHFCKRMTFPSVSWYLFDGLGQPSWSAVGDYLTGRMRGKEGGERQKEQAEEGRCSAVTIGSASGIDSLCLQTISQPFTCNITCVSPINTPRYIMVGLA